jgi:hypothetical protein
MEFNTGKFDSTSLASAGHGCKMYLTPFRSYGINSSLSGVAGDGGQGMGIQAGGQAVILCDQEKVCWYVYLGGGAGPYGGGSVTYNFGVLGGKGLFKPSEYEGFFGSIEGSFGVGIPVGYVPLSIGGYGGRFHNLNKEKPISGWEAGISPLGTPGPAGGVMIYGQGYLKLMCCEVK